MGIWVWPCKRHRDGHASAATGIMIGQATPGPFTRDKKHPRSSSAFRTQNHWIRAGTLSASATCAAVPSPKQFVYIRKFGYFGAGFGLLLTEKTVF